VSGEPPSYAHLRALSDHHGIFEHALLDEPRRDHGYCVDDVARALIVVIREPHQTPELRQLTETYLLFLESAMEPSGLSHNRMNAAGRWTDNATMGDWWGRSLWALGVAATGAIDPALRDRALRAFRVGAQQCTPSRRTLAYAALGAAEIAVAHPSDVAARGMLGALMGVMTVTDDTDWCWPEERLFYGNASLPEALIAAGSALGDAAVTLRGLRLLSFLLDLETTDGRLSVTGTAGRDPGQLGPLFDQQPLEVAAIAEACARAYAVTTDSAWLAPIAQAWAWFLGHNDSGTPMFDPGTGAGFDGLQRNGRNENRGAESTLAALGTYQQARRLGQVTQARRLGQLENA
jgi:hypothetical protein